MNVEMKSNSLYWLVWCCPHLEVFSQRRDREKRRLKVIIRMHPSRYVYTINSLFTQLKKMRTPFQSLLFSSVDANMADINIQLKICSLQNAVGNR